MCTARAGIVRHGTPTETVFPELPKLKNQTVGLNAYYRTSAYSKLSLEYHHMEEFRRGGSGFSLPPHIAEDAGLNGTGARTGGTAETFHQHGWAQVHGFLQKSRNIRSVPMLRLSTSCAIVITALME